jgi:hypothetical protein
MDHLILQILEMIHSKQILHTTCRYVIQSMEATHKIKRDATESKTCDALKYLMLIVSTFSYVFQRLMVNINKLSG